MARKGTPTEELAQLASAILRESGLELFFAEIGRHRLLSAGEEVALAKRVERGDLAAKDPEESERRRCPATDRCGALANAAVEKFYVA